MSWENDPYGLDPFRAEKTVLYGGQYTAGGTEAADVANGDAMFEQILLMLDTSWKAKNGGIRETVATAGITVAQGDGTTKHPATTGYIEPATSVVITAFAAWEDSASARMTLPVVYHNGEAVNPNDILYVGDGKTALELCVIVSNANLQYGPADPVDADWAIDLHGPVRGLAEANMGGVSLPVTEQKISAVGFSLPVIKRRVNEGEDVSLDFTILEHKDRIYVPHGGGSTAAAEILNSPGEEVMKKMFGSAWSVGQKNKLTYLPSGKALGLMLVSFNNDFTDGNIVLHESSAANAGKVAAYISFLYGVTLTEIGKRQNISGGSTDAIKRQFTGKALYAYERCILTANP